MRDAVVEVTKFGGGLAARLIRCRDGDGVVEHANAWEFSEFEIDAKKLPKLDTSDHVATYGQQIRDGLVKHSAIDAELNLAYGASARTAVRFWAPLPECDCFRWEALCKAAEFLALRDSCTVTRLATAIGEGSDARMYDNSLRMAAFLSAAKIPAKDEFDVLAEAIGSARLGGLNINCTFYLGEQELLDRAASDVEAGRLPGCRVEPMPSTEDAISDTLLKRPVELLHFFCHGVLAPEPGLQLATISDVDLKNKIGSALLSVKTLQRMLSRTRATWVTVLNSCEGAAVAQLQSMASEIARRGSPIAVGMAEPIRQEDATIFAKAFYKSLFALLSKQLLGTKRGQSITLDLTPAVNDARLSVYNQYRATPSDANGRWALPILYERADPLIVQVNPSVIPDDAMKVRINVIADYLKSLPPGTPEGLRDEALAVLDKDPRVPSSLRPNRYGMFES
jgi:hypothetical protein